VSAEALRTGNTALVTAVGGSLAALLIAAAAILWAVRQSRVLVDQALSVRLAQLGEDAAAVVDQQLPAMLERLRRREKVDPAIELRTRDYGRDEIGRLADVLNRSLNAAVDAAVEEAKTRAASVAMLMGVARRPQRPLQRGLQVIEDLQNRVADDTLLPLMFDLNHQLAQTRRFLENLIILAGGQTGRRFPQPVPVGRVLLAAIAETRQYRRITLRRAPDVALLGVGVAATTHLVAELLDNALAFSPPESEVWISCSRARRGVVVEIEDAGVGMSTEDREQANALLADAPTLEVTALKDGTQIGFWVVAEIARRAGIQVTLRTSAYGGLLAIVLLPEAMIAAEEVPTMALATVGAGRGGAEHAAEGLGPEAAQGVRRPAVAALALAGPRVQARPAGALAVAIPDEAIAGEATASGETIPSDADRGGADRSPADRGRADVGRADLGGGATRAAALPGARPDSLAAADAAAAARPPLPRRRPQEHLAPKLNGGEPAGVPLAPAEVPARSPEQARSRFSQYQEGWRAGRNAGDPPPA
jgi:signal transduction histidine kinase